MGCKTILNCVVPQLFYDASSALNINISRFVGCDLVLRFSLILL